ncbi:MAG: hypothetical protein QOD87_739 [Pseudonocardiales bacterium]|nr:hypothetical protein [Pseudonocardiales bacterium]
MVRSLGDSLPRGSAIRVQLCTRSPYFEKGGSLGNYGPPTVRICRCRQPHSKRINALLTGREIAGMVRHTGYLQGFDMPQEPPPLPPNYSAGWPTAQPPPNPVLPSAPPKPRSSIRLGRVVIIAVAAGVIGLVVGAGSSGVTKPTSASGKLVAPTTTVTVDHTVSAVVTSPGPTKTITKTQTKVVHVTVTKTVTVTVTAGNAAAPSTSSVSGPSASNCTPGYSPCIAPGPDVDCAGGSGNGPRYVDGPVYVTGSDPYDLDRDGNGIGCQ